MAGIQPRGLVCLALLVIASLGSSTADAQTVIEPPAVSPGARSLGFGGAFVAVADDATASWTNPSGLMQLVRPEISAEGRSWSEDRDGLASNLSSLGFLSFVLPRRTWSLAVYGQTLSSLEVSDGELGSGSDPTPVSDLIVAAAGVSAALRISEDVSVGFGFAAFAGVATAGVGLEPSSFPFFDDEVRTEPGATAGVMWNVNDTWVLAASFRSGADFRFNSGDRAVFPDITSIGGRWRSAGGNATVAAEVERLDGLEDRLRPHLGGEWVFLNAKPLVGLRGGVWYDPEGSAARTGVDSQQHAGDGVIHSSMGVGLAWKRVQVDLGGDLSERTTIVALSVIVTF